MNSELEKYKEQLRKTLGVFETLSDHDWKIFIDNFKFASYKKGENLLSPGDRADFSFFICKGLVKRYFLCEDGREYIINFDAENRMVSDFVALIDHKPARIYIEALEDVEGLVSDYGYKKKIEHMSSTWQRIGRMLAERRYVEKSNREYNLLNLSAQNRLEEFKSQNTNVFERISQKDLASYIGITPQSLSRILKNPTK